MHLVLHIALSCLSAVLGAVFGEFISTFVAGLMTGAELPILGQISGFFLGLSLYILLKRPAEIGNLIKSRRSIAIFSVSLILAIIFNIFYRRFFFDAYLHGYPMLAFESDGNGHIFYPKNTAINICVLTIPVYLIFVSILPQVKRGS